MALRTVNTTEYVDTPHAEFFTRLMMAYNDLATMQRLWLTILAAKKDLNDVVFKGLESYIVRMETSHIFEMANAFITCVMPDRGHPGGKHKIFNQMIDSTPELKEKFQKLLAEMYVLEKDSSLKLDANNKIIETEQFAILSYVRNTLGFHYNHEGNGAETLKALNAYAERCAELNTPEKAMIYRDEKKKDMRFPIADEIVKVASATRAGVKLNANLETDEKLKAHKEFRTGLAIKLLDFANAALIAWLKDKLPIKDEHGRLTNADISKGELVAHLGMSASKFQHRFNGLAKQSGTQMFLKSPKFRTNSHGVRIYETTINDALAVTAAMETKTDMLISVHFIAVADPNLPPEASAKNLTAAVVQLVQTIHPKLTTAEGEKVFNDLGFGDGNIDTESPVRFAELDGFKYRAEFAKESGLTISVSK